MPLERKYGTRTCCEAIVGVLLPPVLLCMRKGHSCCDIVICILLTLLGVVPGILYAFWKIGIPCCTALLCILLPPVGMCCAHGCCCETLICLLLTFTWIGGVWYALWQV